MNASANVSVTTSAQLVILSGLGQTATAGSPQSVTVTLTDSFGNVVTGYVGTVHFTSTDGQAVLPADFTFTAADQGTHTFQVTFKTAGSQSLSVTDTANSSLKATGNVNVAAASQLFVLSGMGQTATAGSPQSVTITVTDSFGNAITGYVGTVHFTSTDTHAVLPADYTFTAADQGKHTFQVTFKTTGAQSVSVTDTANSSLNASANISVTSSAQLVVISGLGQSATAGTAQNVTNTLTDAFGNVITGYVGTVHFTSTDSQASLPADYTFTAADQGKHTFQVTFKTTGAQSVSVTDTVNNNLKASANVSVTSSAQLVAISGLGQSATAGSAQSVTVTLTDSFGNVITGYVGTVHFTSTDGQALLPADYTFTAADQGKHTFQVTFKTAGSQSLSVTDTANSSLKATANVNVSTASQLLVLSGIGQSATAGSPQSVTVAVTDSFGNVITGYVGTVHFTSTDTQAVLPADYTFTAADQGKHTFQVTFKTTGAQSVGVTDTANSTLKASANVSVTSSAQLVTISGLGQSATAGTSQNVTVTVTDSFGNVITGYLGTVHFTSTDGQAVLPADYTFTAADQGKHTFQVTFKTTGAQSVSVTDNANGALKASANVSVTSSAQLVTISGLGQSATAGSAQSVTVTLTDSFGNVITGYVGTVHFTSTDGQALLPADYTFTAADQGKHTFQVTFKTTGAQSVSVTDTANSALKTSANVSVTSSAQLVVISGLSQSATAGTSQNVTITLTDAFGNVITGYVGTVHFTSTDGQAGLPADYAFTAADQGKHTFQVTFKTAGAQSLSVTDNSNSGLKATANVSVTTSAQLLVLRGFTQSTPAGAQQNLTVTVTDSFGNIITNYLGTIKFTSSDGQALLPANYTFTSADQGKHTFSVTMNTAGTQSITVTDVAQTSLKGTISGITVTQVQASNAVRLQITGPTTVNAQQSATFTITALDAQGHVATGYQGTIFWISSDPNAAGTQGVTFSTASQGQLTLSIAFNTTGTQSLSVFDQKNVSLSGALAGITVMQAGATAAALTAAAPSQVSSGTQTAVSVFALSAAGRIATNYQGTLHFQSSDPNAVLPPDYTFTAQDEGVHVFNFNLGTVGLQTLTITDVASPQSLTATLKITVSPATRTWVGLGKDNLWSDAQNWAGGVAPQSGDTVVFSGSSATSTTNYDLPSGVVLNSIVLSGANFQIGGGTLNVSTSIDASQAIGPNTIQANVNLAGSVEILSGASQLTFAAPINLNANTLTFDAGSGNVIVESTLTGTGGMILTEGTLTLAGTGTNTITGTVRVDAGVLQLAQTSGNAITGKLIVGSSQGNAGSASVIFLASNQIADAANVCVNASGLLNLAGQSNSFSALSLAGGDVESGSGILTLDGNLAATSGTSTLGGNVNLIGSRTFTVATGASLSVTAIIAGSGTFVKAGAGTLILSGVNTFAGTFSLSAGTMILNGSLLNSQVVVQSGAVLGGTGKAASLSLQGGSYQPGTSSGSLTVQGSALIGSGSQFCANLSSAGSNELVSTGQITLTGSILKLSLNYVPPSGTTFTIASAAQGIVGTFAGLPEGSVLTLNRVSLSITYHGGSSGNDVVLTVI